MNDFTERMREVLLAQRAKLTGNWELEHERFDEMIHQHDGGDSMDEVSTTNDKKILEQLGATMLMGVQKIDAALARMENGTYGVCVKCAKMIDKERLEAIPEAAMCIDCQRAITSHH
ncbi:TraR/DksA family transcriptional regulator [Entomospira culicis]|uniref:TraR/DksA family transcriptional regulator n=1 Tax=Entomospira culicis TaxID=2719989 RepID=A0A968KUY3_9SPIO|nr:TraR/DksA family transcriptional regulator [Entomospira culicis]NIZ19825.1 TraR/DksA family transcriptional regulator [Entomospira culicis]NIZ70039.1 TraR/DksA family transcriptional regulator [Entomospira culicis]WDI37145.1 TraR/DksA family transcriptional regulator [Entomospira culicis]WDI38774.1 TraR/DksA family transcriptional regulator [Entomospira culicis]